MNYMTKGEELAILNGEGLDIEVVRVSGRYANGVPYERQYKLNIGMRKGDKFHFDLKIDYPADNTDAEKERTL
jgi:hypothetical protein